MIYDFLIIGGGIAGISAAAKIAPHGTTLVLEGEDQLGYHATGRSAASFVKDYGNATVRALNYASEEGFAQSGLLTPLPLLFIARPEEEAAFRAELSEFELTPVDLSDAVDLFPILNIKTHRLAAVQTDAMDLDTHACLQQFRKSALSQGAEVLTKAQVKGISKTGGIWSVTAGNATYNARQIINAAGAWVDQIAQMAGVAPLGFQPLRRSMVRLPTPGGGDTHGWAFTHEVGNRWYAKPDAGALILSPYDELAMEPHDAFADDMTIAEGIDRFQQTITPEIAHVGASWAGLRTFAPDRALVIGRDTADRSFLWCAGQGGYGFQTAHAASDLIGAIAAETTPTLDTVTIEALSPARF